MSSISARYVFKVKQLPPPLFDLEVLDSLSFSLLSSLIYTQFVCTKFALRFGKQSPSVYRFRSGIFDDFNLFKQLSRCCMFSLTIFVRQLFLRLSETFLFMGCLLGELWTLTSLPVSSMGPPQRIKRRITIAKRSLKRRFLRRRSSVPVLNFDRVNSPPSVENLPCSSSACPLEFYAVEKENNSIE